MQQVTFDCIIRYVLVDGAIFILADEEDLRVLEGSIARAEEVASDLEATGRQKAKLSGVRGAEALATRARLAEDRQFLEQQRRLLKAYGDAASTLQVRMHTWTWGEYYRALEEARRYPEDLSAPTVDEARFRLLILASCVDSWSLDDPPSEESIQRLPRQVVDAMFLRLQSRSEPTSTRLDFLRARGVGPSKRATEQS